MKPSKDYAITNAITIFVVFATSANIVRVCLTGDLEWPAVYWAIAAFGFVSSAALCVIARKRWRVLKAREVD